MDNKPDPRVTTIRHLICQYLKENIPMNTDTILKFARYLDVPPDTIDPTLKF